MKSHFVFLVLGIISFLSVIHFIPAYSDFTSNTKYFVLSSGYLTGSQNIYDSTIALQITTGGQNGSNISATLDNGLVTITGDGYLNSGIWQTSILREGKFLVIQGDAQDPSGNIIHLNLFGRIIDSNQDGSTYLITGKITGIETMKVIFSTKIASIVFKPILQQTTPQPPQNQTTPTQPQQQTQVENQTSTPSNASTTTSNIPPPKILLVIKQTSPISVAYNYAIYAKVFFADKNPTGNFDQTSGFVPNAKITTQIFDPDGIIVKSFEGLAEDHGYYSYTFRIPDNFVPGTYTVNVIAQNGASLDNQTLPLYMQNYRN